MIGHFFEPYTPIAFISRGRWLHQYIYRYRGGNQERMNYYYPYDSRSPAQTSWRNNFGYAQYNWIGFGNSVKNFYNVKNYSNEMYGYHLYMRYYLNYIKNLYGFNKYAKKHYGDGFIL